jgi:transposase-like protein
VYFCKRREARKKYSLGFKLELARMHVEERLSYRVIAKRVKERLGKKLSPTLACRMVNEIARMTKSSLEIKRDFEPKWTGYITLDDKWVRVKGERMLSLVAVDGSGDPLHSEVHREQTQEVYDQFLMYLRDRLEYPFRAVTTDFDPRLDNAIKRVVAPAIAHQKCLWHAGEIIKGLIEYPQTRRRFTKLTHQISQLKESLADRKQSSYDTAHRIKQLEAELITLRPQYQEKEVLMERFGELVFASERTTSQHLWNTFRRLYRKPYPAVIRFVATHWEALLRHQDDGAIFKTTARAENINKQLERRYKTIEAFQSVQTAFHYQNLYRSYLRFKPYTDCRGKRKDANGSSPLQLCGATIQSSDWIKNAVRSPS